MRTGWPDSSPRAATSLRPPHPARPTSRRPRTPCSHWQVRTLPRRLRAGHSRSSKHTSTSTWSPAGPTALGSCDPRSSTRTRSAPTRVPSAGPTSVARLLATLADVGSRRGALRSAGPDLSTARSGRDSPWPRLAAAGVHGHRAGRTRRRHGSPRSSAPTAAGPATSPTGNPCNGSPASFVGPDTNSTALAVVGLEAEGALSRARPRHAALGFLVAGQDADGGWGYFPNAPAAPGSTDPDSTALVIQSIVALGRSPGGGTVRPRRGRSRRPPCCTSSSRSGPGRGAFTFPGSTGPDTLATYQAVPAAAGVTDPVQRDDRLGDGGSGRQHH